MGEREYLVSLRSDYSVKVEAETEDEAIDKAIERAQWDAEFDVESIKMTRGEPDPPPLPEVDWIPEPARSAILSSATSWEHRFLRVWCVLVHGHPWATNGCWVFRLPEGTAALAEAREYTEHLSGMIDGATDVVELAVEPNEHEMSFFGRSDQPRMVYGCGEHWPLDAIYVDLLQKICESDRWFRGRPADPGVLRDANGEALAVLMPVRPA